mmetsp:Transcript_35425/g.107045  ORF Transcript_35425/g.107045 Transcript_35425/m.107045 type:complete len:324 (+) Transcript_35425:547-1518(+)
MVARVGNEKRRPVVHSEALRLVQLYLVVPGAQYQAPPALLAGARRGLQGPLDAVVGDGNVADVRRVVILRALQARLREGHGPQVKAGAVRADRNLPWPVDVRRAAPRALSRHAVPEAARGAPHGGLLLLRPPVHQADRVVPSVRHPEAPAPVASHAPRLVERRRDRPPIFSIVPGLPIARKRHDHLGDRVVTPDSVVHLVGDQDLASAVRQALGLPEPGVQTWTFVSTACAPSAEADFAAPVRHVAHHGPDQALPQIDLADTVLFREPQEVAVVGHRHALDGVGVHHGQHGLLLGGVGRLVERHDVRADDGAELTSHNDVTGD